MSKKSREWSLGGLSQIQGISEEENGTEVIQTNISRKFLENKGLEFANCKGPLTIHDSE